MLLSRQQVYYILILSATLEALALTLMRSYGSKDVAAIVYLITGIIVGVLPFLKVSYEQRQLKNSSFSNILHSVIPIPIAIFIAYFGWQAIQQQALDYKYADMLPIIEMMGQRWMSGQEVYAIIPEIWGGMQPIYLPAMWLPYTAATFFELDIRVINLFFIFAAILLALDVFNRDRVANYTYWLILLPVGVLLSFIFLDSSTLVTISEEPIVIGCYVLLGYGLIKNKPYLIGVALACCLLSRYTLLFWALAYVLYNFWNGDRGKAKIIVVVGGVVGLFLMIISKGIYQVELFYSLNSSYLDTLSNPKEKWGIMDIINRNIGLARFVAYEYLPYMHKALLCGSILLPFILYSWYHRKLRYWVPPGLFALCSLKLCLVYFFSMITMPYAYLFYTSSFLSIIITCNYLSSKQQQAV